MKIDGILFDLGSTLIEYENIPWPELHLLCLKAGYQFLINENYPVPPFEIFTESYLNVRSHFRDKAGITLKEWVITDAIKELLQTAGLNGGPGLAAEFFEAYYQPVAKQLTIFEDTIPVLAELRKRGKKLGLISNTIFPENYHQRELERFGLKDFLDFTIFSSSFGFRKPHASIYLKGIELLKVPTGNILFIGDRYFEDYIGPRGVGLRAMIKYREGRDYSDPLPPDLIILKTLSEMLDYIED
jgi:putative hydrolase of the HAD superfamily